MMKRKTRKIIKGVFLYLAVALILISVLLPFFWMVSNSFKSTLEIQAADIKTPGQEPSWIPRSPTLENYITVNKVVKIVDYFKNSIINIILAIATYYTMISMLFLTKN